MTDPAHAQPGRPGTTADAGAVDPEPIEGVWLIEGTYAPDAAETRGPFRADHLARLRQLKADGIVVEAGAFADVSASIVIVRAPDEQAALDLVRDDVYLRNGVWVEVRARAFGRVRDS